MASVLCSCGQTLSDNSDSLYYKARLISDMSWSDFWDKIDKAVEDSGPTPEDKIKACMDLRKLELFRTAFQCPKCGNILIEDLNCDYSEFSPIKPSTSKRLFQPKQ